MATAPKKEIQVIEHQQVSLTPMDMLNRAVQSGANIEILEKLMGLQERWEANQARKAFDAAMSLAKAEMPVIVKDQSVSFGNTNYKYEDMAGVARIVDPILTKHGLSYRYRTESNDKSMTVTCIVSHRDGHFEENSLTAPNDMSGSKNAIQAIGSTQTYLQRYTLKAALGLAASKDDDAQSVTHTEVQPKNVIQPKVTEPPHNPQTGEIGPHRIVIPHKQDSQDEDWVAYGSLMLAAVKTAKDKHELKAWLDNNKTGLDEMEKKAPKIYKRLESSGIWE